MALQDWPKRIGYRWTDGDTNYGLVFDNPQSAIAFVVGQRNNMLDASELLASLYDVDSDKSLADESVPASADDVVEVASTQGTTLPETAPSADDVDSVAVVEPVSDDTTANASPTAANISSTATDAGVVSSGPSVPAPVELPSADPSTGTPEPSSGTGDVAGTAASDVPAESYPVGSDPVSVDDTAAVGDVTSDDPTFGSDATIPTDDSNAEDVDFDSADEDRVSDDGPEDDESAPTIGQPTAETPGVTGV